MSNHGNSSPKLINNLQEATKKNNKEPTSPKARKTHTNEKPSGVKNNLLGEPLTLDLLELHIDNQQIQYMDGVVEQVVSQSECEKMTMKMHWKRLTVGWLAGCCYSTALQLFQPA